MSLKISKTKKLPDKIVSIFNFFPPCLSPNMQIFFFKNACFSSPKLYRFPLPDFLQFLFITEIIHTLLLPYFLSQLIFHFTFNTLVSSQKVYSKYSSKLVFQTFECMEANFIHSLHIYLIRNLRTQQIFETIVRVNSPLSQPLSWNFHDTCYIYLASSRVDPLSTYVHVIS